MRRIIVPTDFSATAFNALKYALELGRILNCQIVVVHAFGTPSTASSVMVNMVDTLTENAEQELAILKEKARKLAGFDETKVSFKAVEASISEAINSITDSDADELVVMGTDGEEDLAEHYFGSHTSQTAKAADVPMLVVPNNCNFESINHILIGSDGKTLKNNSSMTYLANLAKTMNATVELVKVHKPEDDREMKKLEAIAQLFKTHIKHADVKHFAYAHLDIDKGIIEAAAKKKTKLLVIFQRKYGLIEGIFHKSFSRRIINKSKIPVLVLRD